MPKKSQSLVHRLIDDGYTDIRHEAPGKGLASEFKHDAYMAYRARMREFPKFYIAHEALKTFSNSNYDMVIGMVRDGVIGLPRQDMIIELEMDPAKVSGDRYFYIFEHVPDEERLYMASVHRWMAQHKAVMSYPLEFKVNLCQGQEQIITHAANAQWFSGLSAIDVQMAMSEFVSKREDGSEANFLIAGVRLAVTAFLALWITRGVEKREVIYTDQENKKRARMHLKPLVSHTVIKLDDRIEYLANQTYKDKATGKTRMRLHWRCGHKKMQPHGPGNTLRKEVWIAPYLVGCDENGMITHDYSFTGKKNNDSGISADAPEAPASQSVR